MRTAIVLLLLTLGIMFTLRHLITPQYGADVQERFLERLTYIPSQNPILLDKHNLEKWLVDPAHARSIDSYVFPVIVPFDLAFILCLGCCLGLFSEALANRLEFLSGIPAWIWWILPLSFMATDLAEDTTILALFKFILPLTDFSYATLRTFTATKLTVITAAIGQVGFLGILSFLLILFPAHARAS